MEEPIDKTMEHEHEDRTGYRNCAHRYCLAIIIGAGDLCPDCEEATDGDVAQFDCDGCDNDTRHTGESK